MIYVITHKMFDDSIIPKCGYRILQVGEKERIKDGYLTDNSQVNISQKNKYYCELTGIYWIWKNIYTNRYIGIDHYRRFFSSKLDVTRYVLFHRKIRPISEKKVIKYLSEYDVILPQKNTMRRSVYEQYKLAHCIEDLNIIRDILSDIYNDYIETFDMIINKNEYYAGNMFIFKANEAENYCKWLFSILDEFEKRIDIKKYNGDSYQERVFGFLAERLLNVWVNKNSLKVKELPVISSEEKRIRNSLLYQVIKKHINRIRVRFGF